MNDEFDSFPKFGKLPKELRLQIWEAAFYNLRQERLITLWDPLPSGESVINLPQPEHVPNDRLPLLHACVESRSVALPKLTSAFGIPAPGYHLAGPPIKPYLSNFLAEQGFYAQGKTIPRLLEATLVHYNERPSEASEHPGMLQLGDPFPRLEPALWFDFDNDFLLIPTSRGRKLTITAPRWTMCGTLLAGKVRRLAIEMGKKDWDWMTHLQHAILPSKIWSASLETGEVDFAALASVEEICLWTREGCEVCHFTIDHNGLLQPGQWSFSLDTEEEIFKDRFEERWSNVTWRVAFGKDGEKNVCEMLRDWRPHAAGWWRDKISVTKGVEGLGKAWLALVEQWVQNVQMAGLVPSRHGALQALEGGDGKSYLGPSF